MSISKCFVKICIEFQTVKIIFIVSSIIAQVNMKIWLILNSQIYWDFGKYLNIQNPISLNLFIQKTLKRIQAIKGNTCCRSTTCILVFTYGKE